MSRSAFIWAVRKVMPVFSLVIPSMSLAASGSNSNAANTRMAGLGLSVRASSQASSTWRCSSRLCSGPKEITTRSGLTPFVSASACSQRVPASGSTREKSMCWPPFPRRPVFSNSSRHSVWRSVGPERAMEASADQWWSLRSRRAI